MAPRLAGADVIAASPTPPPPRHSRNLSREGNPGPRQRVPLRRRIHDLTVRVKDAIVDFLTQYRVFRVPILNWMIIVLYAAFLIRLSLRFKQLYSQRALITMMVTNILLYGLADTLAQTLSSMIAFRPEPEDQRHPGFVRYVLEKGRPRRILLYEEDHEEADLLELGLGDDQFARDQQPPPPPDTGAKMEIFHFRRLALFTVWGFILSFFQSPWYAFLNNSLNEDNMFLSVLRRVLTDQLCFSPISLLAFFTYTTAVMEGGDRNAVVQKLKTAYLPTLVLNYAIWPAAQFINFLFIPSPMQIPFSSTLGVFWNAYLSLKNASS
jgi:protein Mpv17